MIDETWLRAAEGRLNAAEVLYTESWPDDPISQGRECLDWTRAVAMPDLHTLITEVRRLRAELEMAT